MINEIRAAVEWITHAMEINDLSESQLQRFEWALVEALTHKYTDHWYTDMPWRGQGYRSILSEDCAHVVDHVLRHAAREANITDLPHRMPAEPFVIWVDPGDVEVRFLKSHRTEVVYHEPSLHNPDLADASSASTYRRSTSTSMSSLEDSGRHRSPQQHRGGYRVRSFDTSEDSHVVPDDEQDLRYKGGHASGSGAFISRQSSPPPRGNPALWNGSGSYKAPSKFNLHARPWERPVPVAWGTTKTGPRSAGVGLAGVV